MNELLKQFILLPFPVAQAMGDTDIFMYNWSTLDGLMRIDYVGRRLQIIAVQNAEINNGEFIKFIEMIESAADQYDITVTVTDFFNEKLRNWFIRRGYIDVRKYDAVIYRKKIECGNN